MTDHIVIDKELPNDPVNHPSHYTKGKIECIDFIQDKKLNFCRGNAVKYIVRAGLKDKNKEVEDLQKAIFYLNAEIKDLLNQNKETIKNDIEDAINKAKEQYYDANFGELRYCDGGPIIISDEKTTSFRNVK